MKRVSSTRTGFGQAMRATKMLCCLMGKHPHRHQLTNAGPENSETQLEEVLWSCAVSPVSRWKGNSSCLFAIANLPGHYGRRTFQNVRTFQTVPLRARSGSTDLIPGIGYQDVDRYGTALSRLGIEQVGFRTHTATTQLSLNFPGDQLYICGQRAGPVSLSVIFMEVLNEGGDDRVWGHSPRWPLKAWTVFKVLCFIFENLLIFQSALHWDTFVLSNSLTHHLQKMLSNESVAQTRMRVRRSCESYSCITAEILSFLSDSELPRHLFSQYH